MRDLKYLNLIYDSLDESVGIQTTKLKKFYDNAIGYDSQRNPLSQHIELSDTSKRRSIRYDYGKANYEEISADEALALIKEDKSNIQSLRIIYDLNDLQSLVEYEVRDNGAIYAIYGANKRVVIDGREYKNIRYVPWKKVILNADLIYKTDEYEKIINPEEQAERQKKSSYVQIANPLSTTDQQYNPHDPYTNLYGLSPEYTTFDRSKWKYIPFEMDTGSHSIIDRFRSIRHDPNFNKYFYWVGEVKESYESIDMYRRALKKLERDKEFIGQELYEKRKEKWLDKYRLAMKKHASNVNELKIAEAKLQKTIDQKSAEFIEKIRLNVQAFSTALKTGYELSSRLQTLKGKSIKNYTGNIRNLERDLMVAIDQLEKAEKELERIQNLAEDSSNNTQEAENQVLAMLDNYNRLVYQLELLEERDLLRYIDEVSSIETKLKDIDRDIAVLRPKTAELKAQRAAKNKNIELSQELLNIIDFSDEDEEN